MQAVPRGYGGLVPSRLASVLTAPVGLPLAAAFGAVAWLRDDKALHPRGVLAGGALHRFGLGEATGVPFLDATGDDDVVVRFSRSVGLPDGWPDVWGLSLRVPLGAGRSGDLLLAAAAGRFLFRPSLGLSGRLTSVVPFSTPAGALVLSAALPPGITLATTEDVRARLGGAGLSLDLSVAAPRGPWRRFATLDVTAPVGDPEVPFDPVLNPLPGLDLPWPVDVLRRESYAAARFGRAARGPR